MSNKNTIAMRLEDGLHERLVEAARRLDRSKSWVMREGLKQYLEDIEDIIIAEERLRDPNAEFVSFDDVKRELDLH